ncbi:MAG: hypothetical protein ACYDDO_08275 [Acidiferrobacterales bacterium]
MFRKLGLSVGCMMFSATTLANTADIISVNRQISGQFVSTGVDYTETGGAYGTPSVTLNTESGTVTGLGISFSWMTNNPNHRPHEYYEVQFDSVNGNMKYVGSLIGGTYGSVTGASTAAITNFSARSGEGFELGNKFMFIPHIEIGSHEWDRGVGLGNGYNPNGYDETYTNDWLGVGALGQFSPVAKLVVSADVLVGTTFDAHINAPYIPGSLSYSGNLGNGAYTRLGLSVDYAIVKHLHISTSYENISFSYGAGPLNNSDLYEPDSKTNYSVIKVGVGYSF